MKKRPAGHLCRRFFSVALILSLLLMMGVRDAAAAVAWGDSGTLVRQVQQKLSQWGYFSGTIDGVFGKQT